MQRRVCLVIWAAAAASGLEVASESRRQRLGKAVVGDVGAATVAAVAASPVVATIDQSIIVAAAKGMPVSKAFGKGLREGLLRNPVVFCASQQCRWCILVYASTYAASNVVDSACEIFQKRSTAPKLVATTCANTGTCLAKDAALIKAHGAPTGGPVPPASFGLFLLRDVITMGCAFVLPAPISRVTSGAPWLTQLACPVVAQVFTVVPHLMAIDIFNRPKATCRQRGVLVAQRARGTLALRSLRALPAFGAGVVLNTNLRAQWRTKVQGPSS